MQNAEKRWQWWTNARFLRWLIVALVVFGAGLLPGLANRYEICREEVAQTGNEGVVRVCAPPSIGDLPVIAGALLLVVLLAPDLSEVSIGVLKLKQRVVEQEEKQQSLEDEVARLQMTIQNTEVRQEQRAETIIQPLDLAAMIEALPALLGRMDEPKLSGVRPSLDIDEGRAQLDGTFLHLMARLRYLAGTHQVGSTSAPSTQGGIFGTSGLRSAVRKLSQAIIARRAFPDLYAVIESREDTKVLKVQSAFREEFAEMLENLEQVRLLVASGIRVIDEKTIEKSIDQAGRMISYLTLKIESVPIKPRPPGTEERPAISSE
jgi:hypothetical protein